MRTVEEDMKKIECSWGQLERRTDKQKKKEEINSAPRRQLHEEEN